MHNSASLYLWTTFAASRGCTCVTNTSIVVHTTDRQTDQLSFLLLKLFRKTPRQRASQVVHIGCFWWRTSLRRNTDAVSSLQLSSRNSTDRMSLHQQQTQHRPLPMKPTIKARRAIVLTTRMRSRKRKSRSIRGSAKHDRVLR